MGGWVTGVTVSHLSSSFQFFCFVFLTGLTLYFKIFHYQINKSLFVLTANSSFVWGVERYFFLSFSRVHLKDELHKCVAKQLDSNGPSKV